MNPAEIKQRIAKSKDVMQKCIAIEKCNRYSLESPDIIYEVCRNKDGKWVINSVGCYA